ncbi:TPA: phage tail protein [Serratia marcescens]|uniref:phage tail protein n=1 Tax=Serratia marcescens TaxID=615 RepID=UPI00339C65DC
MNYKSLLKPNTAPTEIPALGQKVFVRRLTSTELDDYLKAIDGETDSDKLNALGVELFLGALVNEDGSRPKKTDLPTVAELLAVHSPGDLKDAVMDVQRVSYGTLEDARKN